MIMLISDQSFPLAACASVKIPIQLKTTINEALKCKTLAIIFIVIVDA